MSDSTAMMIADLAKSGLVPADMGTRPLQNAEKAVLGGIGASIPGYVIPYFDIKGAVVPFYRARVFGLEGAKGEIKYKQPSETATYIYFPRGFRKNLEEKEYVILTEGEKKAALADKLGFPCVALGGVDTWRNRILEIPKDSEIGSKNKNTMTARVPSQTEVVEDYTSPIAMGLQDLIDLLMLKKLHLIIVYDSDKEFGVKPSVQRAAADLAFELRFRGIKFNRIRQLVIPPEGKDEKMGLDDFLTSRDPEVLGGLLRECMERRSAFPRHPNIREYLNKRLQKAKMGRKETQQVSMAVLSDMDANGLRLISEGDGLFYFDYTTHKLMRFKVENNAQTVNHSDFGSHLYQNFGLSPSDHRLIIWLATQFTGEEPLERAQTFRILARPALDDKRIFYQLSDGQFVVVSGDADTSLGDLPGIEVYDNGEKGVLFESEQVAALDVQSMLIAYRDMAAKSATEPLKPWWFDVLGDVRLKDHDKQKKITTLLYYMSPWLYRWRGLQLPVEMILGEPGSGKSTLYELRLNILTGDPRLRNAPSDLKDWHASITNSGGLHVTDNVQLLDKQLRQRLSDEICRIITEPNPFIEMRKYYTEADLRRIPIKVVFGITALTQPFTNADILQRAIVTDLEKPMAAVFDSSWTTRQLTKYGGRESWIAHHLYVLHRFLALVREKWNPAYPAKHRLIHFEQSMCLMAELFGWESDWIPAHLAGLLDAQLIDADWAFEGITMFVDYWRTHVQKDRFTAQDVVNWAEGMPEYEKNEMLINTRRLGRYMQQHLSMLGNHCGVVEAPKVNNRASYRLLPLPTKK